MFKKSVLSIFSLILILVMLSIQPAKPASSASLNAISKITIDYYPAYIPIDGGTNCTTGGTPFAVRATVEGNPGDNFAVKIRLGTAACTWSPVLNDWATDTTTYTSLPRGTIGSDGKATIWLFGRATSSAVSPLTVRGRTCDATWNSCTTNVDSASVTVTTMNMSTYGGWLQENASANIAGKIIVVKDLNDSNKIVGMYKVEDNSVNEGYSNTPGYYKVSAHTSSVNYQIEAWDPNNPGTPIGQVNTFTGDLSAGETKTLSFPTPTAVKIHFFGSKIPTGYALVGGGIVLTLIGAMFLRRRRV